MFAERTARFGAHRAPLQLLTRAPLHRSSCAGKIVRRLCKAAFRRNALRRMNKTKQRVLLGMSGGVDSSVTGYLLREQGYEVIGVTMKVWPQDCISRAEDKCCGPQAVADARNVAHALGIPHYVVDEADHFERVVIDYFAREYQAGRTPNPCVMCNEKLKFGNLWGKAEALGCEYIATGHYAIIEHHSNRAVLRKGVDPRKDQSYFLFSLRQPQLRRARSEEHTSVLQSHHDLVCRLLLEKKNKTVSAAAVAADMLPLAFGTQTACSVIRPAVFCGVVPFKPWYRLIPMVGVKDVALNLDNA